MRKVDRIILHCSDSDFGSRESIDEWHKARGWRSIGYHYVIQNAYPTAESLKERRPQFWSDGVVEAGRNESEIGAHTSGFNRHSIGICLIGRRSFTLMQFQALLELLRELRTKYPEAKLAGHNELNRDKECPNLDMDWLRSLIEA